MTRKHIKPWFTQPKAATLIESNLNSSDVHSDKNTRSRGRAEIYATVTATISAF
ncbi:uncharacterized protein SCHCODRAFT_01039749 [Schizophyllum commune H4-8]|uniref:Expressed protein n=1 Tax=Schizophyllum commune (strain H4-8 / FGSC 9210) TaxID=578458 RepID=D8QJW2_SCHCM|nr:uncharacterized protein SCHCODRAFT_01039749 [Schizophyllum commune H4-8]KAI5885592.1 hypothetical protein SCHCODRAFT_01039749 [Schizophyllum commune H4-8]